MLILEVLLLIVLGIIIIVINLVGYFVMVGVIGGGGLGDLVVRYGY